MSAISATGSPVLAAIQQQFKGGGGQASLAQSPAAKAQFQSFADSLGIDTKQLTDVREQIRSSVEGVRAGGGDRAAVEDAVRGVLEENGIDPADFKSSVESLFANAGFDPRGGGFGGGVQFGGVDTQSDLLSSLFGDSEGDDGATGSDSVSLLEMLSQLPKGSVVDRLA